MIHLRDTGLNKDDIEEIISTGTHKRFTHTDCSSSLNGSAYLSGGGVAFKCHKCGDTGWYSGGIGSLYPSAGAVPGAVVGATGTRRIRRIDGRLAEHAAARVFLASYGIPISHTRVACVEGTNELVVVSRDIEDRFNGYNYRNFAGHGPKWINEYSKAHIRWNFFNFVPHPVDTIVVVEDPISALKISTLHMRLDSVALLGLNLSTGMLGELSSRYKYAIVWTDSDWAGETRGALIRDALASTIKACRLSGIEGVKDPKDHKPSDIQLLISQAWLAMKEGE